MGRALAAPSRAGRRSTLFIDVQHGLCNRLRALVSAAAIAERTNRHLVVIWRPDAHCEASIDALLNYAGPVIADESAEAIREAAAKVYNYMEVEPGARFEEPILSEDRPPQGDIYIRSAYSLTGPHVDFELEQRMLRSLRPSDAVLDLVRGIPPVADVAVHIRMGTGPAFDHLSFEAPDNWPEARHREITEWREKSHVARFVARLDTLLETRPKATIFAAADLSSTYDILGERYGDRLRHLPRDLYDRSPRQLQYALADLMLLASARHFLASTWSSFSDVAQRLAQPGRPAEQSGVDF